MPDTAFVIERLLEEMKSVKELLSCLVNDKIDDSLQMISAAAACKLLKCGNVKLQQLVKSGRLKGVKFRRKDNKISYRFRLADIREFQSNKTTNITMMKFRQGNRQVKPVKDIINELLNKR